MTKTGWTVRSYWREVGDFNAVIQLKADDRTWEWQVRRKVPTEDGPMALLIVPQHVNGEATSVEGAMTAPNRLIEVLRELEERA